MKQTALILIISLAATLSQAAGFAIEGNWGTHQSANGIDFDVTFAIQNQHLVLTNVCSFQGQTAVAQVSVAVTYTDSTFNVLESAANTNSSGGLDCNASVQGGDQMQYQVQGSTLIFTKPGQPGTLVFFRK